jgi:hypothetical protein
MKKQLFGQMDPPEEIKWNMYWRVWDVGIERAHANPHARRSNLRVDQDIQPHISTVHPSCMLNMGRAEKLLDPIPTQYVNSL